MDAVRLASCTPVCSRLTVDKQLNTYQSSLKCFSVCFESVHIAAMILAMFFCYRLTSGFSKASPIFITDVLLLIFILITVPR